MEIICQFLKENNNSNLVKECLTSTYFLFQDKYFQQTTSTPMGSPLSPDVNVKVFMEAFAKEALAQAQTFHMWMTHSLYGLMINTCSLPF